MATRRGVSSNERFALDMAHASASKTLVGGPCFLWGVSVSLTNTNSTGIADIADSSASGDADKETKKLTLTLGAGGVSAQGGVLSVDFQKPVYIASTLVCAITNAEVSVRYADAS